MTISTITKKILNDGTTLEIVSWISDAVRPGERMYQLNLRDGPGTLSYPTNFEDYTEPQIREMYNSIKSKKDFKIMRGW